MKLFELSAPTLDALGWMNLFVFADDDGAARARAELIEPGIPWSDPEFADCMSLPATQQPKIKPPQRQMARSAA